MTVTYNPFDPDAGRPRRRDPHAAASRGAGRRDHAGRLLRHPLRGRRRDQPRREAVPAGAVLAARGGHPHARRAAARRVEPARAHQGPEDPRLGAEPTAYPRARAVRRLGVRGAGRRVRVEGVGRSHRRSRPASPRPGDRRADRRARRGPQLPARVLRPRRACGPGPGPRRCSRRRSTGSPGSTGTSSTSSASAGT